MVAGFGFLEKTEPVGSHVDDRGIGICGKDSFGLGCQAVFSPRFPFRAIFLLFLFSGCSCGRFAVGYLLRGVGECRRRGGRLLFPSRLFGSGFRLLFAVFLFGLRLCGCRLFGGFGLGRSFSDNLFGFIRLLF